MLENQPQVQELDTLLVIIRRYALHIDALKPDTKVKDIPRVLIYEDKFEILLDPTEVQKDRKQLDQDFESIGPMYYSGEKKFQEAYLDIQKRLQ